MDFKRVGLAFVAAFAAGVIASACGGIGQTIGTSCTQDADCTGDAEICFSGVCAQTCTTTSDCDTGACSASGGTERVCTCGNDSDCSGDFAGLSCVSAGTLRVCGESAGTPGDGGTTNPGDGGTNPTSCTGTGQAACTYGSYCSGTSCSAVTVPTAQQCQNLASAPAWSATQATKGYVIYNFELRSGTNPVVDNQFCCGSTTACAGNKRWRTRISAYAPSGTNVATSEGTLPELRYVTTSGGAGTRINSSIQEFAANAASNTVTFTVNNCTDATTQFQPAFYFANGNAVCRQFAAVP
jgi:hypothetical protein